MFALWVGITPYLPDAVDYPRIEPHLRLGKLRTASDRVLLTGLYMWVIIETSNDSCFVAIALLSH